METKSTHISVLSNILINLRNPETFSPDRDGVSHKISSMASDRTVAEDNTKGEIDFKSLSFADFDDKPDEYLPDRSLDVSDISSGRLPTANEKNFLIYLNSALA
jgi:hypothetical protein